MPILAVFFLVSHTFMCGWSNAMDALSCEGPGAATQTNNYMGLVQKFHKGIDYVHIIVHII
jgi:hypothetical protein